MQRTQTGWRKKKLKRKGRNAIRNILCAPVTLMGEWKFNKRHVHRISCFATRTVILCSGKHVRASHAKVADVRQFYWSIDFFFYRNIKLPLNEMNSEQCTSHKLIIISQIMIMVVKNETMGSLVRREHVHGAFVTIISFSLSFLLHKIFSLPFRARLKVKWKIHLKRKTFAGCLPSSTKRYDATRDTTIKSNKRKQCHSQ